MRHRIMKGALAIAVVLVVGAVLSAAQETCDETIKTVLIADVPAECAEHPAVASFFEANLLTTAPDGGASRAMYVFTAYEVAKAIWPDDPAVSDSIVLGSSRMLYAAPLNRYLFEYFRDRWDDEEQLAQTFLYEIALPNARAFEGVPGYKVTEGDTLCQILAWQKYDLSDKQIEIYNRLFPNDREALDWKVRRADAIRDIAECSSFDRRELAYDERARVAYSDYLAAGQMGEAEAFAKLVELPDSAKTRIRRSIPIR